MDDWNRDLISINHNLVFSEGKTYLRDPKTEAGQRDIPIPQNLYKLLYEHRKKQAQDILINEDNMTTKTCFLQQVR